MSDPSPRRMVAIAFGPRTMAEACDGLARVREQADCVELRLDYFVEPFDLPTLLRERGNLPVVVTLRPTDQGGRSSLPPEERLKLLIKAAELGAEYVDLEWEAASSTALAAVRSAAARAVVSYHDFEGMPRDLVDGWYPRLAELGADVVKVVGTAKDARDCLNVLRVFDRADRPTIAIAMGEAGLPTRVLGLRSDACLLTYVALDAGRGTAAGQITAGEMRRVYRTERLTPRTRVYGLLGAHVEIDRLTEYNGWFAADAFDGVAVPFIGATPAGDVVKAFRALPVSGWHVHGAELQRDVRAALDELAGKALDQQKVNAVVRRDADGTLVGHWVESPREQYELWCG